MLEVTIMVDLGTVMAEVAEVATLAAGGTVEEEEVAVVAMAAAAEEEVVVEEMVEVAEL